ncbi:hypothetical protein NC653_006122 [Populus alba x Populus x berolinensis]|uniref:Uncharacterized protein n=1 Tax=Populus alba x Populus x berolinensis TaxID=444605 RepID=A0AAD6RE15_9ROSI|nr:hypothetical protein NC653_006122 [Populus alba x Populus x berolinensis]
MHIVDGMKDYIMGGKVAPVENDPYYDEWEKQDVLVEPWLINFRTPNLMSHFVRGVILMHPTLPRFIN